MCLAAQGYDNLIVKKEKPLEKTKRIFRSVSTSDDPVIQRLASSGTGRVFAVDSILTQIMCMPSSKYGWDIIAVRKVGFWLQSLAVEDE